MDMALAVIMGVGLAAACGFRVFVPLLVLAIATKAGAVSLSSNLAWVGSWEAVTALGTASVLEIVAYKVPWLDHFLDTVATPAAVIAGSIVAATQTGQISINGTTVGPMFQWASAIIAGGAAAGLVQATSVTTRAASSAATAGIANPIISAGESVLSVAASVLAVLAPVAAVVLILLVVLAAVLLLNQMRKRLLGRRGVAQPAYAASRG